ITTDSVRFIFMLFLMLYTLYYFLKEGKVLLNRIMHLSPLGHENEEVLYERFTSTARATMKGTFIIGGIQGILGALLFFITGIKGAFVWGVIMTLLSIIPGIGSFIIWFPAGIIQLALGNLWQGLTILLFGTFVISLIDNLLRPPLVGKDIQMHPLIVLFSTLGGLALFGISGFIIGPIIAALFLSVLSIYDFYYKKELNRN
ncbi:MAG TPA: AI-2E family transporter, partial [Candidatus Kapabacteria bacterium]|nr:AI-2E family transporter [Candidatus Kapabacteria bacterium]